MDYDALVKFVQSHFTDGLALVIGSGLSAAEGMSGMSSLAKHLSTAATSLTGTDAVLWPKIQAILDAGDGLEAALLRHQPSDSLETWIARETCELLLPEERRIVEEVFDGRRTLRLTTFLSKVLISPNGLPILTPNYDRLIEVACEMAGLHVDTTAVGIYSGEFDHGRSYFGACKGVKKQPKTTTLEYYPRGIVLKPHGSFDWYKFGNSARRCSLDLNLERLIITPGLNKYRAGYNEPFDKHRELANDHIRRASRLLVVGYGFNDDHLQTHIVKSIQDGTPTLILNRSTNPVVEALAKGSPQCVCLSERPSAIGVSVLTNGYQFEYTGQDLWDLGILAQELLA